MNHMSEVAKILGVELNEEFKIIFPQSPNCYATAILNNERLYIKDHNIANQDHWQLSALTYLLNGSYAIKRKPWKPTEEDAYWIVDADSIVVKYVGFNMLDADHVNYYKLGNCYRTKEEAEANISKWAAFYKSDEVLEV